MKDIDKWETMCYGKTAVCLMRLLCNRTESQDFRGLIIFTIKKTSSELILTLETL
jgi:hypothetical protein